MDMNIIKRLESIIKTEATTTSIGDFLVTHVPFENLYLDSNKKESISEDKLLNDFILKNQEEHKFIMIQGGNGSGKSHLIRWLKEKYIGLIDSEKEAVLLISRAHNTLEDALTQLLESDIFPEEIKENELKAIKNARSNITGEELKKTINFNFTLEIDADETKENALIDLRTRKWLSTYLKDNVIQKDYLLKDNGPIERIRAKIENVNEDRINNGDDPMFIPEDFAITLNDIKQKLEIADGRAAEYTIRLAEKFADSRTSGELRKKVADYLNTKVSNVIQRSMKLHTADFKKLFASLRKNLKQQGMNLTLFVEDINSFTGIDEALMEVLLTDHTAEGNKDYCRIISVVGSTNDFYNHKINESIKERIKTNIYIEGSSVIGNSAQLARFAAQYINAINLTDEQVNEWVKRGASNDELPIYKSPHKWADINCNGNILSIFPFNETALWKLFSSLAPEKKTPRVVLKSIIAHVIKLWAIAPETFLSDDTNFSNADIEIPYWVSDNYNKGNIQIDEDSATKRGILLRLWGNGTTNIQDGKLGGLTEDVFKAFNVYANFSEIPQKSSRVNEEVIIEHPIISEKIEVKLPAEKPEKLLKIEEDLRNWLNKKQILANHVELRELIFNFIVSGMEWNVAEVPIILQQYINVRGRVHIEGQNISIGEGFVLPRNEESYYLMVALVNWKYLGDNSWHFENSEDYLITATAWLDKNKDSIIEAVIAPPGRKDKWNLSLWNVAALYCVKTLFGGVDVTKSNEEILLELLSEAPNYDDNIIHSSAWQQLKNYVKDSNYKDKIYSEALSYFSKSVGSAKPGETSYKFVDAHEILKQIKELKQIKWQLINICPKDIPETNTLWNNSANFINIFINKIQNIIQFENAEAEKYLEYFNNILDNDFSEASISESIKAIKDFLTFLNSYLNLSYSEEDYIVIKASNAANRLVSALNKLTKLKEPKEPAEVLMKLSKNSFAEIVKFYDSFSAFEKLLDQKENTFNTYIDKESKEQIESYKADITYKLEQMNKKICKIGGASNGNI